MIAKYLKAPFTHKTHLITLIVIGATFITWRLSGGGFSFGAKESPYQSNTTNDVENLSDLERIERASQSKRILVRDQLRNKVLGKVGSNASDQEKNINKSKPSKDDSLGDIEKLVGLR
jgi:uncharacterized protein YwgA